MAVLNLESLVLCGSTVLLGGKADNPRRGTSDAAHSETPEIRISMRHPSPDYRQEFPPAEEAGRSPRRAGVLSQSYLRRTADNATTVSAGLSPAAIAVVKRCPAGLAWCKPASTTPSASTWGHGVR